MALIAKIWKPQDQQPDELEQQISQAMLDLEQSSEIKAQLKELYFVGAKELDAGGKKCVIIYVPVPQLKPYQKIQPRLVRELEKKFSGKHVVIIARRRILPKPKRGRSKRPQKQKRPRSRTLTSVHDAILGDLVFPAEIVGKRTRIKLDGSRLTKVHLDKNSQTHVDNKLDAFVGIYKHLCGKEVHFEFVEPLF